jgi:hypothetical protein
MTTHSSRSATPRLRFDKVALRLVQGVRDALKDALPDGLCVLFAVTAPIREPSKTTTALVATIRSWLSAGAGPSEHAEVLYGNQIRVRIVTRRSPHAARIAGFVHDPLPPPDALLDIAQSFLEGDDAPDVARNNGAAPDLETLRRIREQMLDQ